MTDRLPSLRRAAGGLLALGLLARMLGLLRELLVARYFGVSADLDAVYLGMAVPMALTVGIGTALVRSSVTVAAGLDRDRLAGLSKAGVRRLAVATLPLAAILALTSPLWAMMLGGEGESRRILLLSAALAPLSLLSVGVAGLYTGLVHARGGHTAAALVPLVYNLIVCGAIVALQPFVGAVALLVGSLVAEASQIAVMLPFVLRLTAGATPRARSSDYRALVKNFWPAAVCAVLLTSNIVVDRIFASTLEDGSIAALAYADKLVNLPAGLIATALVTPLFTRLSRFQSLRQRDAYRQTLLLGIRLLLIAGAPMAVFLAWTAEPAIGLLLQRGAFDQHAVELSSSAFRGYAAGIPFIAFSVLLTSAGLTVRNPWRVAWIMGWTTALNALLDWLLAPRFGVTGIALSTSIVALVRTIWMLSVAGPELLRSRSLRGSLLRVAVWSGALWIAGQVAAFGLAPSDAAGTQARIVAIALCGAAMMLATVALWRPLLEGEWCDLFSLRRRVATFMHAPRG